MTYVDKDWNLHLTYVRLIVYCWDKYNINSIDDKDLITWLKDCSFIMLEVFSSSIIVKA